MPERERKKFVRDGCRAEGVGRRKTEARRGADKATAMEGRREARLASAHFIHLVPKERLNVGTLL